MNWYAYKTCQSMYGTLYLHIIYIYYTAIILIQSKTHIKDMWPYITFPVLYNRKPYFFRIGRPEKSVFFCIVHYVREVTRLLHIIYIYLCFIFYKKENWFDVLIPKFRSGDMCIFFTSKDSKSIVKTS
jgi:hypothetical protein